MSQRYETLGQLRGAIELGHVKNVILWIDNDCASAYADEGDDSEKVLELHPYDLMEQALDLLGIPHEHV